jgi:hypothetical protein
MGDKALWAMRFTEQIFLLPLVRPFPEKMRCLQKGVTAMKKRNRLVGYFVLLMLTFTFVAGASTSKHTGSGGYISDSVITTKVKFLLAKEIFFTSFRISVKTYKGIVHLSGFVDSQQTVNKAAIITLRVKGIKGVNNNLIVK